MSRKYKVFHSIIVSLLATVVLLGATTLAPVAADTQLSCDPATTVDHEPTETGGTEQPGYCTCQDTSNFMYSTSTEQFCAQNCPVNTVATSPDPEHGTKLCSGTATQPSPSASGGGGPSDSTVGQPIGPGLGAINISSLPGAGGNNANANTLQTVLQIVFGIAGVLALLVITVAGLRYVTAAGDPQQMTGAKNAIVYALVGLLVAIFAEVIVSFVVGHLV